MDRNTRTTAARQHSFLRSKIVLVLGIAVFVFIASALYGEYRRRAAVQAEIQAIEDEISELSVQRQRLGDLLEQAETPEFLEREARLRLGLQKPGEETLIVPLQPGAADGSVTASGEGDSNFKRWWRHIFPSDAQPGT